MSYNFSNLKENIKKIEEWFLKECSNLRTGQATPSVLDSVFIDSYGSLTAIKNVASVGIEDPKTLRVSPWDKGLVKAIEKAIISSSLGLSVSVDESGLRVIFPHLTTENRVALVKVLKDKLEEARKSVRVERDEIWSDIQDKEKEGAIGEDDKFRHKEELQKLIDEINNKLEEILIKKEKEILGN